MTKSQPSVALATCAALVNLTADDRPLIPALADRDITATPAVWDDPSVDWAAFDLVVVRTIWDYSARRDEFCAWAEAVPRIENPAAVLRWNTDKSYLKVLEAQGVPVIPTIWLDPNRHLSKLAVHTRMPAFGDFVVKPVVSAGARDTGRYQPISAKSRAKAIYHALDLLESGRWVMIQPYVTSVDTKGETSLTFIDGKFTHATRKEAMLTGPAAPTVGLALYADETITGVPVSDEHLAVANRALEVAAADIGLTEPLLYARVDVLDGEEGPVILELELCEPNLRMEYSGPVPTLTRFADAIAARVRNEPQPTDL